MDDALGQFLGDIATRWWVWAVAGVLLVDQALRAASAAYRDATDRRLAPGPRGALSLVVAVAVVLAGGFLAFRDANARLAETQQRLAEAEALRPQLKTLDTTTERFPDGTYKISKLVEIVSRVPPGSLHIVVTAKGISDLRIEPQSKRGMMIHGPSSLKGDTITDRIQGPVGKYLLVVRAASAQVTLEHHFE
jgi:hypothetical protein